MANELEVIGFKVVSNAEIKALLNDNQFVLIDFSDIDNDETERYFGNQDYYNQEIIELLQRYLNEAEDFKIEKED